MQIDKFEKKAAEFIQENNLSNIKEGTFFVMNIQAGFRDKRLAFQVLGNNRFIFEVEAEDWDTLFDKAFRVLKAYGPKATRERGNTQTEETTEPTTEE